MLIDSYPIVRRGATGLASSFPAYEYERDITAMEGGRGGGCSARAVGRGTRMNVLETVRRHIFKRVGVL